MPSILTNGSNTASTPIFSALGDPTRLSLLSQLSTGDRQSIAELCRDIRMTRQAVTKHLGVLEAAGLVHSEKVGREKRFVYSPEKILSARAYLDDVARQWDSAIDRLKNLVES